MMITVSKCKWCKRDLIVGQNWYEGSARQHAYICVTCHRGKAISRARDKGVLPQAPSKFGIPARGPDGNNNPEYQRLWRRSRGINARPQPGYGRYGVPQLLPNGKSNPEYQRRAYAYKHRIVLVHYSGTDPPQCADPYHLHEKEWKVITIYEGLHLDHINNNGAEERRQINDNLDSWLIANNFPEGYQVLCANCDWLKWVKFSQAKASADTKAQRKTKIRVMVRVISYYSHGTMACADPYHIHLIPFVDIRCLTIDHINGDGAEHRRKSKVNGATSQWLWKQFRETGKWPDGFQVLCHTCQEIKRIKYDMKKKKLPVQAYI